MSVLLEDRKIYVTTKGTQTVKICTSRNIQSEYEKFYRITPPFVLTSEEIEGRIEQFSTIVELENWLKKERNAKREPKNEISFHLLSDALPIDKSTPNLTINEEDAESEDDNPLYEILDLISPTGYSPDNDSWLSQAKVIVEDAINKLIQEFIKYPYLHRVEHSIHAHLFKILTNHPDLNKLYPLGNLGIFTQLVHKEWPETTAREGRNRRGNFDLVVLSPQQLQQCNSIDEFLEGRMAAPIVIEMGLDYDAMHLANDAKKLLNSQPKYGYLIHLVRESPMDPRVEQIILNIEVTKGIRTAYGRIMQNKKTYKLVNDKSIIEE